MTPKLASAAALSLILLVAVGWVPDRAQAAPSSSVRLTGCATAPARYIAAEGMMRSLSGASRMQIRFELQSRTPDRPAWHTLVAAGFGIWNTADPSVRRYVYQKRVEGLAAPADYRMVVQFRWLDGTRVLAQQRKVTRVCRQPEARPDRSRAR